MTTILTVPEAARVLGLDPVSVYAQARSGALPSIRVGTSVRIPAAALAAAVGVDVAELERLLTAASDERPAGLLSPAEVAQVLRMSRAGVVAALTKGALPGVKHGGRWFCSSSALAEALGVEPVAVEAQVAALRRGVQGARA